MHVTTGKFDSCALGKSQSLVLDSVFDVIFMLHNYKRLHPDPVSDEPITIFASY